MPRYNVFYNGKWACYSSVVDDFITDFMTIDEYEKWRDFEYGRSKPDLTQHQMAINEAVLGLCLNEKPDIVRKRAKKLGIDADLIEAAIKKLHEVPS